MNEGTETEPSADERVVAAWRKIADRNQGQLTGPLPSTVTVERSALRALIEVAERSLVVTARPPMFWGSVLDAGGGQVDIVVDRDTATYPAMGTRVSVYPS